VMFLNGLYSIEKKEANEITIKLSSKEHPVFQAHFPEKPILPGFIHLEIIEKLFNLDVSIVKKAKFITFVAPLESLKYKINDNKTDILCMRDDKTIAQFKISKDRI